MPTKERIEKARKFLASLKRAEGTQRSDRLEDAVSVIEELLDGLSEQRENLKIAHRSIIGLQESVKVLNNQSQTILQQSRAVERITQQPNGDPEDETSTRGE